MKYCSLKKSGVVAKMLASGLFFISISATAQYSNSWINFNQPYYKILVAKEGIYKLTYADLQSANFPVNAVDPRLIKLFHRGKEQAISIPGEADAVFDPSDFIEFYGQKNDGTLDKNLYKGSTGQPHSFYNLYSDTTAYFLTYSLVPPAGKRMASFSEVNVANLPKENYHNEQRLLVLSNNYSGGNTQDDELQYSQFDQGEGWMGIPLQQNQSVDYVLDLINNSVPSMGSPQLEIMLVGRDNIAHAAEVSVGMDTGSLRVVGTADFFGFETPLISSLLNWSDIGSDGKITIRIKSATASTNRYQFSAAYIKITFPQSFNAAGVTEKVFRLATNSSGKSYIEIDNTASNVRVWDITDPDNVLTIGTHAAASTVSAMVANTETGKNILASNTTAKPTIQPISFRPINAAKSNFLIVTNKALMKPALAYGNVVQAYASYRASVAGGSYDTLTVSVDQLYNQFNYGETSPLAIYEFMKYMVGGGNPSFLFIIGKGRDIPSYSPYQRKTLGSTEVRDLVPSAGLPASDMAFTAGLGGTTYEPKVATGRLPATTPLQVADYLNKIMETEAAPLAAEWKKQGLHLSGGIQSFELPLFRSYVDGFKGIAKGKYWGAEITTIGKREPNPIELINVSEQVNKGTNLITFFGHSSPGLIEIDIGFVTDPVMGYNNPGKYPVFLINGCFAGAFFLNGVILGEDWILAANKGARNFIAHTSYGFSNTLKAYSDLFYQVGFADSTFIQKGVGAVQQEVARRYLATYGNAIHSVTQVQQMILLGDPAVKLFGTAKPDYTIDNSSLSLISLDGLPVTSLSNSFGVKIVRKNLGASGPTNALPIRLIRTFSDNTAKTYDSIFSNVLHHDTIVFKLPREINGAGVNQLTVVMDPLNTIKETSKLNNTATFSTLIPANSTLNLFPTSYAITKKQAVKLVFQSTDLISDVRDFQIQLDTTSAFNSPYLKTQTVSGKVLATYNATLLTQDSTVYYWRTRFDQPKSNESKEWSASSFTFIKNGTDGWGQLKFPQFAENAVIGLSKDAQLKKFSFLETIIPISVTTFGGNYSTPTSSSLKIDNVEYNLSNQGQPCRNNTINFVAFNKNTAVPYAGIPFVFQDPRTCGRTPQLINSFLLNELETGLNDDLATYVDAIQTSDSVLIFSIGNPGYQSWSANVKSKLGNFGIGASQIDLLQNGEPVVILGKKGAAVGTAMVIRTTSMPADAQALAVSKTMTGRAAIGKMKSMVIGPAKSWIRLTNQVTSADASDVVSFSIYGLSAAGTEELLKDSITGTLDLSSINAQNYPNLKLEFKTEDPVELTAVQLKKWIVEYEPVAEGILVYEGSTKTERVQEGQAFSSNYSFVNISEKLFPSQLSVKTDVLNKIKGSTSSSSFLINPPKPGDTTKFSIKVDSKAKVGFNDISVFVNPKKIPEQYYNNNSLTLPNKLEVTADKVPPVLEVKVDGRTLRNNDFVSNSPLIQIVMLDENQFLYKIDTTDMLVFLKVPCNASTCLLQPIYFSRADVAWTPASSTSDFQIMFNPKNLAKGTYTLRVAAADASGNKSGPKPYEINFQVSDVTTLSLLSVYPNPSTSNFIFSFVLTGNVLPDNFQLQIFSLDGRLLHSFDQSHVQSFTSGTNELRWDATDTAGNLPGGIYVYRLNVSANGITSTQRGQLILSR